jgi:hypothetical protein
MKTSEAKEFQLVYQAQVPGKKAVIRTGVIVCKLDFGRSIPDYYVLPLDTWDDDFWRHGTSKNFQGVERWHRSKEEAIDRAQEEFTDALDRKAEQEQEGIYALNDLRNLVRCNE